MCLRNGLEPALRTEPRHGQAVLLGPLPSRCDRRVRHSVCASGCHICSTDQVLASFGVGPKFHEQCPAPTLVNRLLEGDTGQNFQKFRKAFPSLHRHDWLFVYVGGQHVWLAGFGSLQTQNECTGRQLAEEENDNPGGVGWQILSCAWFYTYAAARPTAASKGTSSQEPFETSVAPVAAPLKSGAIPQTISLSNAEL